MLGSAFSFLRRFSGGAMRVKSRWLGPAADSLAGIWSAITTSE
jgi:hypothetical protein